MDFDTDMAIVLRSTSGSRLRATRKRRAGNLDALDALHAKAAEHGPATMRAINAP